MSNSLKRESLLKALKNNLPGVTYVAGTTGGRHILEVSVDLVRRDPFFTSIRMSDPPDISLLQQSTKETDGPVYLITVFIEADEGKRGEEKGKTGNLL